jgi:hypothetical protein
LKTYVIYKGARIQVSWEWPTHEHKGAGMCIQTLGLHGHHPRYKGEKKRGSAAKTACTQALECTRKPGGCTSTIMVQRGQPQRAAKGARLGGRDWRAQAMHKNINWGAK